MFIQQADDEAEYDYESEQENLRKKRNRKRKKQRQRNEEEDCTVATRKVATIKFALQEIVHAYFWLPPEGGGSQYGLHLKNFPRVHFCVPVSVGVGVSVRSFLI